MRKNCPSVKKKVTEVEKGHQGKGFDKGKVLRPRLKAKAEKCY